MKKKLEETIDKIDPTLPFTEIEIDGKSYKMCLDFEAIAHAESEIPELNGVSLLACSWNMTTLNAGILFAVSLRIYQPEIAFDDARRLVTWQNSAEVCMAIRKAQNNFIPEPDEATEKADPPQASGS